VTRKRSNVEAALQRKGFEKEEGDHHYFILLDEEGRRTSVFTKTSHSPKHKDLGPSLLGKMARQCRLRQRDFLRLVDCTLDEKGYRKKLKADGAL